MEKLYLPTTHVAVLVLIIVDHVTLPGQATEDLYQALDERRQLMLALADRGALLAPGDEPGRQLGRLTAAAAALDSQVTPPSLASGAAPYAFYATSPPCKQQLSSACLHTDNAVQECAGWLQQQLAHLLAKRCEIFEAIPRDAVP